MIVIVAKYLIPKGYLGFAFFPFVFLSSERYRADRVLLNHERIHLRQQLELLIVPFYIWYFSEYAMRWIRYRDASLAYKNISFEREAYANEQQDAYLRSRGFWSFLLYL